MIPKRVTFGEPVPSVTLFKLGSRQRGPGSDAAGASAHLARASQPAGPPKPHEAELAHDCQGVVLLPHCQEDRPERSTLEAVVLDPRGFRRPVRAGGVWVVWVEDFHDRRWTSEHFGLDCESP